MKDLLKRFVVLFKYIFWKVKINKINNGKYLISNNVKHLSTFIDYKTYGAPNKEEYDIWIKQTCGIVSLKMLTDYTGKTKNKTIYEMAQESKKYKAFTVPSKVSKASDIKGIFHDGLLEYARHLGLNGFREGLIPLEKAVWLIYKGWFFLASVNIHKLWGEKWINKFGERGEGKHIVLVIGFKKENNKITKIYYKDCATACKWNKETDEVNFNIFKKSFNNRGLFIKF